MSIANAKIPPPLPVKMKRPLRKSLVKAEGTEPGAWKLSEESAKKRMSSVGVGGKNSSELIEKTANNVVKIRVESTRPRGGGGGGAAASEDAARSLRQSVKPSRAVRINITSSETEDEFPASKSVVRIATANPPLRSPFAQEPPPLPAKKKHLRFGEKLASGQHSPDSGNSSDIERVSPPVQQWVSDEEDLSYDSLNSCESGSLEDKFQSRLDDKLSRLRDTHLRALIHDRECRRLGDRLSRFILEDPADRDHDIDADHDSGAPRDDDQDIYQNFHEPPTEQDSDSIYQNLDPAQTNFTQENSKDEASEEDFENEIYQNLDPPAPYQSHNGARSQETSFKAHILQSIPKIHGHSFPEPNLKAKVTQDESLTAKVNQSFSEEHLKAKAAPSLTEEYLKTKVKLEDGLKANVTESYSEEYLKAKITQSSSEEADVTQSSPERNLKAKVTQSSTAEDFQADVIQNFSEETFRAKVTLCPPEEDFKVKVTQSPSEETCKAKVTQSIPKVEVGGVKSSSATLEADFDANKYFNFHLSERNFDKGREGAGEEEDYFDTFAGCNHFTGSDFTTESPTIRSSKGTIRGVKNRVRAGIATFLQIPANKNWAEKEAGKVVVYTTSMGIIRETYQRCLKVRQILRTHLVKFEERDIAGSREVLAEIKDRMNSKQILVPQVFVEGQHIGDAETIDRLNESGELRRILKPYRSPDTCNVCQVCGGYQLLPCALCSGSKKSVHRNQFTAELVSLKCVYCDEVGLVKCYACTL